MTAAVALADPERLPFAVREGAAEDLPFVNDSWLQSEREATGHAEGFRFGRWQRQMQRHILSRPSTRLRVCTPEDDPQTILGWLAYSATSPPVVYYVFVRYASRRLGMARLLLGDIATAPEVLYTARPARVQDSERVWRPHPVAARIPPSWRHAPRAAFLDP